MKKYEKHIDINTAMSICIRAGVKVYPILSGGKFKVELNDNGQVQTFKDEFSGSAVANAVHKTWRWYANKLISKPDAK